VTVNALEGAAMDGPAGAAATEKAAKPGTEAVTVTSSNFISLYPLGSTSDSGLLLT